MDSLPRLFSKYLLRTYCVLGATFGSVPELREQGRVETGVSKCTGKPGAFRVGAKYDGGLVANVGSVGKRAFQTSDQLPISDPGQPGPAHPRRLAAPGLRGTVGTAPR